MVSRLAAGLDMATGQHCGLLTAAKELAPSRRIQHHVDPTTWGIHFGRELHSTTFATSPNDAVDRDVARDPAHREIGTDCDHVTPAEHVEQAVVIAEVPEEIVAERQS